MRVAALIPLRGGSKSIPLKNIKLMAGKPLCYWTIRAACGCKAIQKVYVSTESDLIKRTIKSFGFKKVSFIDRPVELAGDEISTEAVILHALHSMPCDTLFTIQATSPLTTITDLERAIKIFKVHKCDSLLSAVRTKRFFWGNDGKPLNYIPQKRPRRQDFSGTLMENGAFYITKRAILERKKCRLGGRIGIYEMGQEHTTELDELTDWDAIEKVLIAREVLPSLERIKVIVTDFDGVLTDNRVGVDQTGKESVICNRSDGWAVKLIKQMGLKIACISTETNQVVAHRCRKQGLPFWHGQNDKLACLKRCLLKQRINPKQCLFIGNDTNDLTCLEYVGFPVIPRDAASELSEHGFYTTKSGGGEGVLREVAALFQEARR